MIIKQANKFKLQLLTRYYSNPTSQYTLGLIKPDLYIQHENLQLVLDRIRQEKHINIVIQQERHWSLKQAEMFYKEHEGRFFFQRLTSFMSSGPFLALILQGPNVIKDWRSLIGPTKPDRARLTHTSTLRAHFGMSDTRNSFHGSDSPDNAEKEISLIFPDFKF